MASSNPTGSGSLADRVSKPEPSALTTSEETSHTSWADEVNSPTVTDPTNSVPLISTNGESTTTSTEAQDTTLPQVDGATETFMGSDLHEPDFEVNVKLADMQADPNNPLYSAKTFEQLGLNPEVLKGVYGMKFLKPSKVQERTLPLLLMNPPHNLIGQSQSGTGKTAAFVLNILQRIDISNETMAKTPQALVLAPTRELARQIVGVVKVMGIFMENMIVEAAIPTTAAERGRRMAGAIVVGTPGTVFDIIKRQKMSTTGIKVLVLDEADNMLDMQGLGEQCTRVKKTLSPTVQVVLFSATFPEAVVRYAETFAPGANQMTLRHEDLTVEGIKQIYLDCPTEQGKYDVLVKFYGLLTIGSSIIFVKKRETATEIEARMTAEGHKVVSLTGAYEGQQRDTIIDAFRLGKAKVLITTNVLSRGIDVQSVSMVVNYDVPDKPGPNNSKPVADPQTYLHRIGRTGRFGRVGVAVTFVSNRRDWEKLMEIQKYFGSEIVQVSTADWDDLEDQVTKIIKSSRAGTNFQEGAEMQM